MTVSCYTLLIRYTYGKEHKQGGIMEIYSIKDEKFRRYGKVWSGFDCTRLIREMEHTPLPENVIYVPSMEELEVLPEAEPDLSSVLGAVLDRQPVRVATARTLAMSAVSFFFICRSSCFFDRVWVGQRITVRRGSWAATR